MEDDKKILEKKHIRKMTKYLNEDELEQLFKNIFVLKSLVNIVIDPYSDLKVKKSNIIKLTADFFEIFHHCFIKNSDNLLYIYLACIKVIKDNFDKAFERFKINNTIKELHDECIDMTMTITEDDNISSFICKIMYWQYLIRIFDQKVTIKYNELGHNEEVKNLSNINLLNEYTNPGRSKDKNNNENIDEVLNLDEVLTYANDIPDLLYFFYKEISKINLNSIKFGVFPILLLFDFDYDNKYFGIGNIIYDEKINDDNENENKLNEQYKILKYFYGHNFDIIDNEHLKEKSIKENKFITDKIDKKYLFNFMSCKNLYHNVDTYDHEVVNSKTDTYFKKLNELYNANITNYFDEFQRENGKYVISIRNKTIDTNKFPIILNCGVYKRHLERELMHNLLYIIEKNKYDEIEIYTFCSNGINDLYMFKEQIKELTDIIKGYFEVNGKIKDYFISLNKQITVESALKHYNNFSRYLLGPQAIVNNDNKIYNINNTCIMWAYIFIEIYLKANTFTRANPYKVYRYIIMKYYDPVELGNLLTSYLVYFYNDDLNADKLIDDKLNEDENTECDELFKKHFNYYVNMHHSKIGKRSPTVFRQSVIKRKI